MARVKDYFSLIKFSHTIFAMPFALIGFVAGVIYVVRNTSVVPGHHTPVISPAFAEQWKIPGISSTSLELALFYKLILVIGCMVFARSAAMAFNRYLDREFDARNPRTAIREIPAGVIGSKNALKLTIVASVLFIGTAFLINKLCFFLAPVALFVILGYSYTKRFTSLCHLILGVGLALAPIGAYLAVTGSFHIIPILFSFAVLFWVSGFDIIYALQDEEFDRSQKLHSIPAMMGKKKALRISEVLHVLSAASIIYAGYRGGFGWIYWIGAVVFIGMLIYQHAIVKPHDLRRINIAFMTANGIASIVFAIFVITDMFLHG